MKISTATAMLLISFGAGHTLGLREGSRRTDRAIADAAGAITDTLARTVTAEATTTRAEASARGDAIEALAGECLWETISVRHEQARAWRDCAVPGRWLDLKVIPLPQAEATLVRNR